MNSTNRWQSEREVQRVQTSREELVEHLARAIHKDGTAEPLNGLRMRRASSPTGLGHGVSYPSFCVIAQGSKEILLGDNRYRYDPAHYLIATVELPIASRVAESSPHPGRQARPSARRPELPHPGAVPAVGQYPATREVDAVLGEAIHQTAPEIVIPNRTDVASGVSQAAV